jgi:hypothetical protein
MGVSDLRRVPRLAPRRSGESGVRHYNEVTFRSFLAIERERARRTKQPFLLVLVDLKPDGGAAAEMRYAVAHPLFEALAQSIRETDFTGWYLTNCVVGAALTQPATAWEPHAADIVMARVRQALEGRLPADVSTLVRIQIQQEPSAAVIGS